MNYRLGLAACFVAVILSGCAKRVPVYDEAGETISEQEIKAHQGNSNFMLYTLGGGALSLGVGVFAGTLVERAAGNNDNDVALWSTAGAATVVGTTLFAIHGKRRDRNKAIQTVIETRIEEAEEQLAEERERREKVQKELRTLKTLKEAQEKERQRLLKEIQKKKKDKPDNR